MKAIVTGMIVTNPVGGCVWDYGQYALGLERLGFDVYYLEDTGWMNYDPDKGDLVSNADYGVPFLQQSLGLISATLADRWHIRTMEDETFGMDPHDFASVVAEADLFLNVSGGTLLRDDYMVIPRKVLIDTDPGWNHFRNWPRWESVPDWHDISHGYRAHDFFFTYANGIGKPDCKLPLMDIEWTPTQPPVVTGLWKGEPPGRTWTTVMTWDNFKMPIEHEGIVYGTKEMEFRRIEQLPNVTDAAMEIAVGGRKAPRDQWRNLGWSVVQSQHVSRTPESYKKYVESSRGEVSVAKNLYVATRSGWFSCRSTCYLAAGRPVVLQETGWSEIIRAGEGVFAFANIDEAGQALAEIESDYAKHSRAARQIALEYFDSNVVLRDMLDRVGLEDSYQRR